MPYHLLAYKVKVAPWPGQSSLDKPSPISSPTMPADFPEVQGGGSLILAWQIRNKHVLVVGGGEVEEAAGPLIGHGH